MSQITLRKKVKVSIESKSKDNNSEIIIDLDILYGSNFETDSLSESLRIHKLNIFID